MRNSSIFSIATNLTHLREGYQVGIFIPPKVGNSTPPLTPGAEWTNSTGVGVGAHNQGATIYESVYTEDTQNSEVGYISYDKDLDVSTGNKVSGQYNIQAVKQITYLGVDASSLVTNDYMMMDGAGWPDETERRVICPFGEHTGGEGLVYGAFCNKIETGSSMNLKVANLNTQMGDRFIMKSADPGVAVYNNVGVDSYATDLPSKGSVSAYIKGSIKEGGRAIDWNTLVDRSHYGPTDDLYEVVTFSDSTGVSGDISTFAKTMGYSSVIDASGDHLIPQ